VYGISADTPAKQKKFKEKYDLPYPLLADVDKKVCKAFDVIKDKNMYGKIVKGIARTTFVIDKDGKIAKVFENVKPDGHAEEVLSGLK
jgi:peroxiredoxin Q/BCP